MKTNPSRLAAIFIFFGFLCWIFSFRGFLSSKLAFTSDALSYYDHIKFFIDNLGHGVYPLWDPFWYYGSPNDFFLRRIGAFNPFYLVILLFKTIGIPYTLSYLWFLALYFWGGSIAFYLLAMRIYNDRLIAYAGYLMFLFSSLGTRLFDSYMMLITVPLVWFFYFLVAFTQNPKKHLLLGMALSFMVLAGTYIPFYFLLILFIVILFFSLFYFDCLADILLRYWDFLIKNKILVLLSALVVFFSFIPIINFFHDSLRGEVVLPLRHGSTTGDVLAVPHQTLDWGVVEDLMYSYYFSNLKLFKFAVVYVPFFSVILFLLGLVGRISRRAAFMFLSGIGLFCCIVPHGLPFYDFFYRHVFFLKYFRNLHFFIWFFLMPLFILLVLEHWNIFKEAIAANTSKWQLLAYAAAVHIIVLLYVWYRQDAVISTYLTVLLSFTFWTLLILKRLQANAWGLALLTLVVLIQPAQAYYYLTLKAEVHVGPYEYDKYSFNTLKLQNITDLNDVTEDKGSLYYASGEYNFLYQNISNHALFKYLDNKILLVDRLVAVDNDKSIRVLERRLLSDDNTAIVFNGRGLPSKLIGNDPHPALKAQYITDTSNNFKLLSFDANHIRMELNVPYDKFMVYNDSYDPNWKVSVNGRPTKLFLANGAFKGVWVPAGNNVVEFRYGAWWQYAMNELLSILALILLTGIIWYAQIP